MEHRIIELLSNKMTGNLRVEEIVNYLGVSKDEVKDAIKFLEEDGTIFLDKSQRYCLTSKTSLKKGTVKVTKRKGPIVVLEDGNKTELNLLSNSHKKVMHNDLVLVEPFYKGGNAQLVKVLKRYCKDYVGEVVQEEDRYMLMFKDGRKSIKLSKKYPAGTRLLFDGETGVIKQVIGHKDDPDELVKELLLENKFQIGFSEEYEKELESIPDELSEDMISEEKRNGRLDIRKVDIVTIDGDDTKDFDDAVCFWKNTFIVAIADTTTTIREGSIIDKTTIQRAISVYPPGMVEPMIAHKISNGICSLNPHEDRFSVGSISRFDEPGGERVHVKSGPMIINSKKRMTYEDVNMYLENGIVLPGYEAYTGMLEDLYNFAIKQKHKMLNEGFLEFSSTEVKMAFDEEKVSGIRERHHGKAEELIEFSMLYHNILMTSEFIRRGLPFIARNHDLPRDEKVTEWNNLLSQRGYKVETKKKYNNEDIKKSLSSYSAAPEKVILDSIGIRTQSKAKYSAYNMGHFALGLKAYATFTSPIRRLSDYINQRVYIDALKYGDDYARRKWEPRMESLARIATDAEFRSDKVEKEAVRIRMAEYMASNYKKGDKFTGYIASIGEGYFKVLLPNMVYCKVYYGIKNWTVSKDGFSLTSNLTGERLLVGDSIDVSFKKVNIEEGEVIFSRQHYEKDCVYEEKKGKARVKRR